MKILIILKFSVKNFNDLSLSIDMFLYEAFLYYSTYLFYLAHLLEQRLSHKCKSKLNQTKQERKQSYQFKLGI